MLKLINAGLGRTGTTSLQVALERLGYGPCYHMFDIVSNEERLAEWEGIVCDGKQPDWPSLFDGFASIVDGPPSLHYAQIMKAFPEAKVVLTVRDAEGWYRSTHDTLYQFVVRNRQNPPEAGTRQARMFRMINVLMWDGLLNGRFDDGQYAMDVYRRYNQDVIDSVPADRLLVYDVQQGWEPLCTFLGADVPAEEFPHVNSTASMRERMQSLGGGPPAAPEGLNRPGPGPAAQPPG
ncbi:sulfotransferase family protein [Streptomyces synnematoformans]|uniref:Sulfotransferase family protein n=1 Tax=Streptomyces synnematoformans TaxID=415721 RepID=A0ABN2A565_9ACTN